MYKNKAKQELLSPHVCPAPNIHKDQYGGLQGLMIELDARDSISNLDDLSENVFGGISIVRCCDYVKISLPFESALLLL